MMSKPNIFRRNKYTLNNKISSIYSPKFHTHLNPRKNILVSEGAREALNSCLSMFLGEGDEAIVIDPSYEIYRKSIKETGAKSVAVPLVPRRLFIPQISKAEIKRRGLPIVSTQDDQWDLDFGKLRASLNSRTKVLVLNSPHNPTGKIFTEAELEQISRLLRDYPDVVVLDDRVYEHAHFQSYHNKTEVPKISDIKGMWNKTITIYSGGKLLRCNGLKCGWMIGPSRLIDAVSTYSCPSSLDLDLQLAVADSLDFVYSKHHNYLQECTKQLLERRDLMVKSLIDSKYDFNLWVPQAGYFVLADISNISVESDSSLPKDFVFCVKMCSEDRVASIPCSSFFEDGSPMGENLIRFAFCKDSDEIREAGKRLKTETH